MNRDAFYHMTLDAESGNVVAQQNLAKIYETGVDPDGELIPEISVDYPKALKWFHLAAEQGDAFGQYILGSMFEDGQAVPQDYKEAVKWYRLSAEQGLSAAQCGLGEMYYGGEGVSHDYAEAIKWWKLAAEQGHEEAQYNLDNSA